MVDRESGERPTPLHEQLPHLNWKILRPRLNGAEKEGNYKIALWNASGKATNLERVDMLQSVDASIVIVQNAPDGLARYAKATLPEYAGRFVALTKGMGGGERGVLTLSKFPITLVDSSLLGETEEAKGIYFQTAHNIGGRSVRVANVYPLPETRRDRHPQLGVERSVQEELSYRNPEIVVGSSKHFPDLVMSEDREDAPLIDTNPHGGKNRRQRIVRKLSLKDRRRGGNIFHNRESDKILMGESDIYREVGPDMRMPVYLSFQFRKG